jgi:hypothetical protein
MKLPNLSEKQLADFPPALRQLIDAELKAGNEIVEISSSFPAPPAGAYVKLARPITTRARVKTPEIDFYDRNGSSYSGEWHDGKRFFFVLEPPHPPEPEVNMDDVRNARRAAAIAEHAAMIATPTAASLGLPLKVTPPAAQSTAKANAAPRSLVARFEASMVIDYEMWHDGIGYDLRLLKEATPADLKVIEAILLKRGASDWRDIEALAALDTAKTRTALRTAMKDGNAEIRGAVLRYAPALVPKTQRLDSIIRSLQTAEFYGGLSQALDEVAEFHPPEIVAELFRGVLQRKGDVATHFAAMVMFVHGKAKTPFDWDQRPFFLKFQTKAPAEREALFRELCGKVGVDPADYLPGNSSSAAAVK